MIKMLTVLQTYPVQVNVHVVREVLVVVFSKYRTQFLVQNPLMTVSVHSCAMWKRPQGWHHDDRRKTRGEHSSHLDCASSSPDVLLQGVTTQQMGAWVLAPANEPKTYLQWWYDSGKLTLFGLVGDVVRTQAFPTSPSEYTKLFHG